MKKLKNLGVIFFICIFVAFLFFIHYTNTTWPIRFKSELDQFFGKGNWEYISEETKESLIYTKYISSHREPPFDDEIPGKYNNWYIKFFNKYGTEEICKITDHTFKINNDKYWIFNPKRYSKKQALVLELMNISCEIAGDEVLNNIIKDILPENIANCLRVSISYEGGNPEPSFYNELFNESWFNTKDITTKEFLECDLHDFYLDILAFNYKVEKLTEEEKEVLFDSTEILAQKLLDTYGKNASFKIYFDKEHNVEYVDGEIHKLDMESK